MSAAGGLDRELGVAVHAAQRAAAAILEQRSHPSIQTKADGSPVTSADFAADEAIRAAVREAFPGDAILTEEGADDPSRLSNRRCWIADPLDGTSYFIAGSDDFDTFVALAVDGAPMVAVSLQPVTGLLVWAVAGRGAWMDLGNAVPQRLALSTGASPRLATKAWLGAPGNLTELGRAARAVGGSVIEAGFSLCPRRFLPPAAPIDAMIGIPATASLDAWEWDIAPGDLIVREGGGAATDLTGMPLRYNKADPRFGSGLIIATDRALHRDLVAALGQRSGPAPAA